MATDRIRLDLATFGFDNGFFWENLWNHSSNADLKSKRKDPSVLMEGDIVHIPDAIIKQVPAASGQRRKFKLKGVPARLNLRFALNGKPRANIPYTLYVDGLGSQGTTDGNGWVRAAITPNVVRAILILRPTGDDPETHVLGLGHLDPIDSVAGQQARLKNLGFLAGDVSSEQTPEFLAAISAFQRANGLPLSGVMDQSTQQKLKDVHLS